MNLLSLGNWFTCDLIGNPVMFALHNETQKNVEYCKSFAGFSLIRLVTKNNDDSQKIGKLGKLKT